ncbi:MAG: OmpA family protein [Gemmatimonadetes bacterium]|nr:OmpA family protein [Gemmatimonadota bacterium]NIR78240.1 OmpA family protein [Gemmatimonadota bacterium]NIT86816.1 OmpA family protein [Gemmatimonadota bacterium]NIU30686.1 OmpA family protein [Gemmatimonadota bacterium]NIU35488.1 OmpA family protein [Gemmatimonadota bacterium]
MKLKLSTILISAMVVSMAAVACGGQAPPPEPEPQGPSQEELEQMRQDSIRRAREAEEARRRAEEARRREEEMRRRRIAEARETLRRRVHFDFDRSNIRPDAEAILREKVEILRASPQVRLRLAGHADERGSNEYNLALGSRRAESVKQFFVNFGLAANRFETVSFGEERPVVDESNEEAWAMNRRVETEITAGSNMINPPSERDR